MFRQHHDKQALFALFKRAKQILAKMDSDYNITPLDLYSAFADILLLKLMGEWRVFRFQPFMHRGLDPKYYWYNFVDHYRDHDLLSFITQSVWPQLQALYQNVLDKPFRIHDAHVLQALVDFIDAIPLIEFDTDILGDAYEYFLRDTPHAKKTYKNLGQFFTPRYLARAMVELIDPKKNDIVCDPFCGSGGLLLETFHHCATNMSKIDSFDSLSICGNEITSSAKIAQMNLMAVGGNPDNIKQMDTLSNPIYNRYDAIVANIPFSQQTKYGHLYTISSKYGNSVCMQYIFQSLKNGGRAAVIVPESFLYGNGAIKKTREMIIRNSTDIKVLSLPRGVFEPYTPAKTSLLYFVKGNPSIVNDTQNKIYLYASNAINAVNTAQQSNIAEQCRDDLFKFLTQNDCGIKIDRDIVQSNHWNLRSYEYLKDYSVFSAIENDNTVALDDKIVEEIKDYVIPQKMLDQMYQMLRATNRDMFTYCYKIISEKYKRKCKRVRSGDIIYHPYTINIGSIGVVPKHLDGGLVESRYVVLRIKDQRFSPFYLISLLKHPNYLSLISNYALASSRISFTANLLKQIRVPIPPYSTTEHLKQIEPQLNQNMHELHAFQGDLKRMINTSFPQFAS